MLLRLVTALAALLFVVTPVAVTYSGASKAGSGTALASVQASGAGMEKPFDAGQSATSAAPAPLSPGNATGSSADRSAAVLTLPNAMAALGDSITRGFNACGFYADCVQRSWSTGTSTEVGSHYLGILSQNPAIDGKNFNDAKTGAVAADMVGQARQAVTQKAEYVTLLIGANDACRPTEGKMTSVTEYRKQVAAALKVIKSGLPHAKVFIASIPNVKKVWETGSGNFLARAAWKLGNICQSLLANPTSHAAADNQRRDRVVQRVVDYNSQLRRLCSGYGANCKFDGDTVFNFNFGSELLSNFDFFHPNGDGQRTLAQITRQAGFQWQPAGNPVLP